MAWHRLEPADATIFRCAPQVFAFPIELPVPPRRVWESLVSDQSLAAWPIGPGLHIGLRWSSSRPFGVGTTREVTLPLSVVTFRERFFRWSDGERYSFYAEQVNRPGLRRFAEDYVLQAHGTGTLLTWTVAIEPSPWGARVLGPGAPLTRLAFSRTAVAAQKYFAGQGVHFGARDRDEERAST